MNEENLSIASEQGRQSSCYFPKGNYFKIPALFALGDCFFNTQFNACLYKTPVFPKYLQRQFHYPG